MWQHYDKTTLNVDDSAVVSQFRDEDSVTNTQQSTRNSNSSDVGWYRGSGAKVGCVG